MSKQQRPIQMTFRVNQEEYDFIKQKMASLGIRSNAAYLRKMAMDGYMFNLDFPEMRQLPAEVKRIGNNVNQIAKAANAAGTVSADDIDELKAQQQKLWDCVNAVLSRLNKIK